MRHGDGTLSNNLYHKIAGDVLNILDRLRPGKILTFEMRGLSGHIDHIAMSMISTEHRALIGNYFVCFPPGYKNDEVDEIIDVSDVWEQRIEAILCHASQEKDMLKIQQDLNEFQEKSIFW